MKLNGKGKNGIDLVWIYDESRIVLSLAHGPFSGRYYGGSRSTSSRHVKNASHCNLEPRTVCQLGQPGLLCRCTGPSRLKDIFSWSWTTVQVPEPPGYFVQRCVVDWEIWHFYHATLEAVNHDVTRLAQQSTRLSTKWPHCGPSEPADPRKRMRIYIYQGLSNRWVARFI